MDAATIRLRLFGHGDLTAHRDGTFTLSLTRPHGEFWSSRLQRAIRDEVPGAVITVYRRRPAADRYFDHHEVVFSLGQVPAVEMVGRAGRAA